MEFRNLNICGPEFVFSLLWRNYGRKERRKNVCGHHSVSSADEKLQMFFFQIWWQHVSISTNVDSKILLKLRIWYQKCSHQHHPQDVRFTQNCWPTKTLGAVWQVFYAHVVPHIRFQIFVFGSRSPFNLKPWREYALQIHSVARTKNAK